MHLGSGRTAAKTQCENLVKSNGSIASLFVQRIPWIHQTFREALTHWLSYCTWYEIGYAHDPMTPGMTAITGPFDG
jgi:hypothetical protein